MTCAFVEQPAGTGPVRLLCRVLEVSPSGDAGWRSRSESARSVSSRQFVDNVRRMDPCRASQALWLTSGACGLARGGPSGSRRRTERLMRRHGIRALAGRRYRHRTNSSRHDSSIAPNLLKQQFSATLPDTVWLAEPKDRVATSPTCLPMKIGATSPPCSISPPARSSARPCATNCGLS